MFGKAQDPFAILPQGTYRIPPEPPYRPTVVESDGKTGMVHSDPKTGWVRWELSDGTVWERKDRDNEWVKTEREAEQ